MTTPIPLINDKADGTFTGPGAIYVDGVHVSETGARLIVSTFAVAVSESDLGLKTFVK